MHNSLGRNRAEISSGRNRAEKLFTHISLIFSTKIFLPNFCPISASRLWAHLADSWSHIATSMGHIWHCLGSLRSDVSYSSPKEYCSLKRTKGYAWTRGRSTNLASQSTAARTDRRRLLGHRRIGRRVVGCSCLMLAWPTLARAMLTRLMLLH